jgi:nucleotide-binding universal stress UspA family protein
MFKRILVPLDGSHLAATAVAWAERLAAHHQAEVFLLQVVRPLAGPFTARPSPFLLAAAATEQQRAVRDATLVLSNLMHKLHGRGLIVSRYVEVGWPAPAVLDFVRHHAIDLVIMATHSRAGLARAVLGSVADEIRRAATVPVLLIPPGAVTGYGANNVLICLDESPEAETALDAGLELAQSLGARVSLLEVAYGSSALDAAAYLADASQAATALGLSVQTIVSHGDPGSIIVSNADLLHATVSVLASRDHWGVARAIRGSVASFVVSHAHRPVLLTHRAA